MLQAFARRFFGSANERKLKPMWRRVEEINALEPRFQAMADEELRAMTAAFRERDVNQRIPRVSRKAEDVDSLNVVAAARARCENIRKTA